MVSRQSKEIISAGIVFAFALILIQPAAAQTTSNHTSTAKLLLVQQNNNSSVKVTGVKVNNTDKGIEIILESANPEALQPTNKSTENSFIVDIPNAVLALPEGKDFNIANPVQGIISVSVSQADNNTVQLTVTGESGLPAAELFDGEEGLIFEVVPKAATTPPPEPEQPEEPEEPRSETPSEQPTEQPTAETDESIELVVTATRTGEELQNIPRSVTVITREQLDQQTKVNRDLQGILSNSVPGLGASSDSQQSFAQTLRGRPPLVLVDGVPISSNIDNDTSVANLRRIDVEAIERIEVVRGPSAVYGDGAAGGVINIITRRPNEDKVVSTAEIGVRSVGNFKGGSFGNFLSYGISGKQGGVDFIASFTRDSFGTPFDAEGDRIPLFGDAEAESASINFLGKLGFQLGSEQRLQITANYFNDDQNQYGDYDLTVGELPGINKARLLDRPVEFVNSSDPFNRGTVIQFDYTHNNILNSQLQAQAYYRQTKTAATLFDNRIWNPDGILDIGRSVVTAERFGGRLQLDTALSNNLNLLWGADYSSEDSKGDYDLFDVAEFDNSNGRIARKIGSSIRIAPFTTKNLGLFSQVKWEASEKVFLSGGLRYENINVSVVDNWVDGDTGLSYRGGEKTLDDVVFNAGVVYKATPTISLFANFAQGFSLPNISRIVQRPQAGFNFAEDVELSAPQKVDSYELGIRGQWNNFQASLAGFYSYSSLGTTIQFEDFGGDFRILRAPQRNYGIELAADWQPSDKWKLGSTLTWSEGERQDSATGEFVAMSSFDISPLKLTAYIENETLPGWNNRLQGLYIGNRNRAFDAEIDPIGVNSYFVMDLISSLKLGDGTLSLGVRNLLNNQYLNVSNQIYAGYDGSYYASAARGRTFTLNYRWSW
ncbi:TonB-dependent receptor domain-containing protein [Anabaena sp. CA = ATCC 33047]|uniref:TonB-dependent receptor domain-containing protein n=1 Tax=Anabaena sp. (strain CA / ATCC 33047) TaxID=52271 RepID=UPI00082BAADB|nr:TonB-dependent receptor [Anabaena sp. CA = ATCC 33047]